MAKEKRIVATGYAIVSGGIGSPSSNLKPGDSFVFDEDNETHAAVLRDIESGKVTNLELQEVDVKEGEQDATSALEGPHPDDAIQAPARALEQEVREAQISQGKDAKAPKEAREGAKEVQESVEAEQERQAAETADEGSSGSSSGRQSRRKG